MLQTPSAADSRAAPGRTVTAEEPALPLDLLELELSLDGLVTDEAGFADALRAAADGIGGEFLFDLPASGLSEDCRRIAALRLPEGQADGRRVVFALLEADGASVRVERPDEDTEGLRRFAEAFIDVLERM
ncbi:hypothetical protein [Shinella pollutisoli]|uniref:Uncharacterized protein n=1 Tax=Shinella pollutisoli TaxID=2250594 RepID=A0ABV7DBN1_9HYPH|nr:hypothetical protein [Shinella pollutisoli]